MVKDKDVVIASNNDFPRKWEKKLPEPIGDTKSKLDSMGDDELKKKIVEWQQAISNAEKDMENDPKLCQLKEDMKEKSLVYRETISECSAQMRYSAYVLESRGK